MAHSSSVFSRVPIDLPNRSGFDLSHENLGTMTCGTLVPVLVDELLPNDTISLGASFQVQLPPMATDFFGRIDYVLEAFFVPNRLLWGGWKSFMTHPTAGPQYPSGTPVEGKSKYLPQLNIINQFSASASTSGTLIDYMGVKDVKYEDLSDTARVNGYHVNALPFLAYHRIWDDWYRDSRIQSPLFYHPDMTAYDLISNPAFQPYVSGGVDSPTIISNGISFSDGKYPTSLRQRNWSKDYFTSSSTLPQAGNAATLTFDVDTAAENGTFSIAALRAANSLQKWMERNNIAGYKYSDQIYAQYGIYPSDAIMDKCIYLGRKTQNVYTRSVFQTSRGAVGEDLSLNGNPFKSVGSKFGSSQCIGEGSLVDNIRVTEHGFLIVLASLVPHAYYSSGLRRYLTRKVVGDIAFPLLSGMGDQAIMTSELFGAAYSENDSVFGYTDLYAEYKYHDDEIHGFLRDGESLQSFALQRSFDTPPQLSSEFLQIPIDYLKQVFAITKSSQNFDCWYDIYFPYKKVSTLPEYSLPTLADLKDVHKGYMSRGGHRL